MRPPRTQVHPANQIRPIWQGEASDSLSTDCSGVSNRVRSIPTIFSLPPAYRCSSETDGPADEKKAKLGPRLQGQ